MNQPFTPLDPLFITIVLATLAIGLPILMVLAIRFLWDRNLSLGRSKELDKLVWQLHRVASALEHQMNLSFPAVQPGTEEPRDSVYLKPIEVQPKAASPSFEVASAAAPAAHPVEVHQSVIPPPATPQAPPPVAAKDVPAETPQRAGVNSMFGL